MCVGVRVGAMGCGKSKHRSMEDSENDMKNNKNNSGSNNSSSNNGSSSGGTSSGNSNNKKDSWSGGSKRKKHNNSNDNKTPSKDGDKEEKTSPFKLLTNGKSNRSGSGRSEEVGVPAGLSASGKTNGNGGEKSNGTLSANRAYALEIPDEINKPDSHQKTTCRDFKSLTSSKTVHVTSSQIEFFKMLDEKIEKGDGYTTSADVSEVSSLDEHFRH